MRITESCRNIWFAEVTCLTDRRLTVHTLCSLLLQLEELDGVTAATAAQKPKLHFIIGMKYGRAGISESGEVWTRRASAARELMRTREEACESVVTTYYRIINGKSLIYFTIKGECSDAINKIILQRTHAARWMFTHVKNAPENRPPSNKPQKKKVQSDLRRT